jgi:dsRNA-specific ribonuclease
MVEYAIGPKSGGQIDLTAHCTSPQSMVLWKRCFTSPLKNVVNYDTPENTGDLVVALCTNMYARSLFPGLSADELSNMVGYYDSNKFHYRIMQKIKTELGLDLYKFLEIPPEFKDIEDKVSADLYEAIFGTFLDVANNYAQLPGQGFLVAYNWYLKTSTLVFREEPMRRNVRDNKTILRQLFSRFNIAYKIEKRETSRIQHNRKFILCQFYIRKDVVNALISEVGVNFPRDNDYILDPEGPAHYSIGDTKEEAEDLAAQVAVTYLAKSGYTPEWATHKKRDLDAANIGVIGALQTELRKRGYVDYTYERLKKYSNEHQNIMQLLGVREDGTKVLLFNNPADGDVSVGRIQLVQAYLAHLVSNP